MPFGIVRETLAPCTFDDVRSERPWLRGASLRFAGRFVTSVAGVCDLGGMRREVHPDSVEHSGLEGGVPERTGTNREGADALRVSLGGDFDFHVASRAR